MFIVILLIVIAILVGYIIYKNNKKSRNREEVEKEDSQVEKKLYNGLFVKKDKFLTEYEKSYLEILQKHYEGIFIVQPQICLFSILNKNSRSFPNELFRTIDIGIFDEDYNILLLIEINDKSHYSEKRKNRDEQVKAICDDAKVPLISYWNDRPITENDMLAEIDDILRKIEKGKYYD